MLVEYGSSLPIGTILMYDGEGWTDNNTLPGWFQCNGSNGTPNLTNKFIKGSETRGQTGGANSRTLSAANLPSHSHTFSGSTNLTGAHQHLSGSNFSRHGSSSVARVGVYANDLDRAEYYTSSTGNHAHSFSGTTGAAGSGTAFDNQPEFYTVIYIKRMS